MNKEKKDVLQGNYSDLTSSKILNDAEFAGLNELFSRLKIKYDDFDILNLLEKEKYIPLSTFNKKLSSLELISKYLHENENLSLIKISKLLNRSNRNIWNAYNKSKKKSPKKLVVKESPLLPVSVLRNLDFTLLENIVSYLKEKLDFTYHEIAVLLHRDDRTIWTVYQRAKKKRNIA